MSQIINFLATKMSSVGRSTTFHILAFRRSIEGVRDENLQCIIIEFKKAIDSEHRGKMDGWIDGQTDGWTDRPTTCLLTQRPKLIKGIL